jgi:acetyl esterase/lipase
MRTTMRALPMLALALTLGITRAEAREAGRSEPPEVVRLWPGQAPGTEDWKASEVTAEATVPGAGKIQVITNVTVPTLTVFRPSVRKANGTAMVILPGGSFRALAWDVDGLETAQWLAGRGITAFVLKYRVRPPVAGETFGESLEDFARATQTRRAIAVADAAQAIRFIRLHARRYALVPAKVGVIGFSAGAMATVEIALSKDAAVRPDFAVAMYGAALTPELPNSLAPPLFIAAAQDDQQLPAQNSVALFQRWTKAGRPAELHLYEKGGHGFGFRRHLASSDAWPAAFQAWLVSHGFLPQAGQGEPTPASRQVTTRAP